MKFISITTIRRRLVYGFNNKRKRHIFGVRPDIITGKIKVLRADEGGIFLPSFLVCVCVCVVLEFSFLFALADS